MKRITSDDVRNWLKENRDYIELVEYSGNAVEKSKFRCTKCGYEWEATFHCVKHSFGCPSCGKKCRVLEKDAVEWLKNNTPEIEIIEYGGGVNKPSKFRCTKCGNEWESTFYMLKKGVGCPVCSEKNREERKEKQAEEIREWLSKNNPNITLVKYGGTYASKSRYHCSVCGTEWETSFSAMKCRNTGCPKCSRSRCVAKEKVEKWLSENKPTIEMLEYGGMASKKSLFHCKTCGKTWSTTFSAIKNTHCGCPVCSSSMRGAKLRVTEESVREWIKENRPEIELVSYNGSALAKSSFRCKDCGNEWLTSFSAIKRGCGCPKCAVKSRVFDEDKARKWLSVHKPNIELVSYGGSLREKSTFRCKLCGYEWKVAFNSMRLSKTNCRNCKCQYSKTVDSVNKPVATVSDTVSDVVDDEYKVVEIDE